MEEKHIIVTIKPSGTTSVEAVGFNGEGCVEATEQIELMLGGAAKRDFKPEFQNPALDAVHSALKQDF